MMPFVFAMRDRLEEGARLYGTAYLQRNLIQDIREELLDIANYAYLQYLKLNFLERKLDEDNRDIHISEG